MLASSVPQSQLLTELEQRQDDVLAQLDQLNARLESLIERVVPARQPPASADLRPAQEC